MRRYPTATKASIIAGALTATLLWMPAGSASAAPSPTVEKLIGGASLHSNTVSKSRVDAVSRAEIIKIIKAEFKGTQNDAKAVRVADCESGLDPRAVSNTVPHFFGLFQFKKEVFEDLGGKFRDILDAKENSRVAYIAFKKYGWQLADPSCARA